ncbi:hypothetical protein ACFL6D_03590 [Spirochaetota bacterium]
MENEEFVHELKDKLVDGKLPCAQAFSLSHKYSIPIKDIGDYANKENIKITDCQLGCFPRK